MSSLLSEQFNSDELLYRGVVKANWDYEKARPSSATFKDSNGISVDRDGGRSESECIEFLLAKRKWKAIARVTVQNVLDVNAIVIYKPVVPENLFHSEIHDSTSKLTLPQSKSKKLRDLSTDVYTDNSQ
jgi:hypothetical protein